MPGQVPKPRLRLTDTTFRDANQSLLGGRLRPREILPLAKKLDGIGFFALEAFGGATFETSLRLGDDPWQYLRELAKVTPNTPIQALIRGQNLVGHRNYADDAVELFVKTAANLGVEVFRVFDPLNDLRNMEVAIRSAKKAGARVQGALSYAISPVHDHDFWCSLAKGLAAFDVQDLVIKDTSGLLTPQVAWELVTALKEMTGLPVIVHSHCSSGMAPMSYMAGIEAGAAVVDTALSPLAWGASQPATESVVAALAGGDYDTGLDLEKLIEVKLELEQAKRDHVGDFSPWVDRVDADILRYQMPGFMLEDISRQLEEHSAVDRTREVMAEVPRVRKELGYPPLVAPIRQLIAAQAVYNILGGERYATVTQELKDYLQGLYGRPPRPAEAEIRRLVLGREEPITVRPADLLEPQVEAARSQLKKRKLPGGDDHVLTYLLFPQLALELMAKPKEKQSGDGRESGEEAEAVAAEGDQAQAAAQGDGDEAAAEAPAAQAAAQAQSAEFDVEVEGETFKVRVTGAGLAVLPAGGSAAGPGGTTAPVPTPKAPAKDAITAPMQGLIVKLPVKQGDEVKIGEVVAVLEAMKMQNDIVASKPGRVTDVYVKEGEVVTPNQPLVAIA
ncbi:MAG: pyruvate carboxylase subunit B [Candidatus Dormibacter sp.]|uniref:pyruvate carboxylase subunit B n=1 Tax=Candidatus Dormibacter sp. TaxID=2973982 RepID=UPI000DB1C9CB|nr:MAG: pyruvate carboxylase subunit B [Candidatus Dormibacteraeota bacterium]